MQIVDEPSSSAAAAVVGAAAVCGVVGALNGDGDGGTTWEMTLGIRAFFGNKRVCIKRKCIHQHDPANLGCAGLLGNMGLLLNRLNRGWHNWLKNHSKYHVRGVF